MDAILEGLMPPFLQVLFFKQCRELQFKKENPDNKILPKLITLQGA